MWFGGSLAAIGSQKVLPAKEDAERLAKGPTEVPSSGPGGAYQHVW